MRPDLPPIALEDLTTPEALDLLAWWSEPAAAAFGRTLHHIRSLPEVAPCPHCDGLGVDPRAWTWDCRHCGGTGQGVV